MKPWMVWTVIVFGWCGAIGAFFFIVYLFVSLSQQLLSKGPGDYATPYVVAMFIFSMGLAGSAGFLAWVYGEKHRISNGRGAGK